MASNKDLVIQVGHLNHLIFEIRGQKVMLDADLARLYGVPTKRLNEQVKRNRKRFPAHFMFQLTTAEKAEVVANCDRFPEAPPIAVSVRCIEC